jgi:hypothetical protein
LTPYTPRGRELREVLLSFSEYVYICIYIHIFKCIHICICVYMRTYTHTIDIYISIRISIFKYISMVYIEGVSPVKFCSPLVNKNSKYI